jgi:WD40 repeat protein/tetratricopeptide (TPR) repeat protein
MVGPYKLLELIGEGGMGAVWMAEQRAPVRRRVALKVIKAGMDTRQVVARIEAERQALALMDHPHIARVFDGGAADSGRPYFVMELVKGVPLTRYCDDHKLTPRQRLGLFVPVCQAVQHAHQKGVTHRDLKPSNILVAPYDGRPVPKVIDFGIAKAAGEPLTEKTLFTGFGAVVGTPEYMSPEQAELNNQDIDTRSDVYSLGVLLYELLTGTTPLTRQRVKDGALLEVLRLVREEEPPRPSTRLSTTAELPTIAANRGLEPAKLSGVVRGELDWIVMKALEKDRSRRYDTANGLAMDLERYLADEPVLACPPSAGYRLRKLVRRHRTAVTVAGLVAALLLLGIAVSTALAVWAIRAEGLAQSRLESETAERREQKRQLVKALLAQARAGRWSRQVGQRFEGLKALKEAIALARELEMDAAVFQDLRDEAIACLALADLRPLGSPWEGQPLGSSAGRGFDAELERYARSDEQGNVEVRQVEGDRLLASLSGRGPGGAGSGASDIRFSPDGTLLAVTYWHQISGSPTNFWVWDWRQNEVVFQPEYAVAGVDFSPDGRRLALGLGDGTAVVYAVRGWNEVNRLKAACAASALAFQPDGTRLAVAGPQGGKVQVWEVTGNLAYEVTAPDGIASVAWHPGGDLLAAGCNDGMIRLWNGATGRPHAELRGHLNNGIAVAFAAGGDLLVSSAWDGSTRLWDSWTGRELLRFTGDGRFVSRDGRRLASRAGRTFALWEVASGREYAPFPPSAQAGGAHLDWGISPDGRWLVAGARPGRVWDLARRKEVASLPGSRVVDAKFHPNGHEVFIGGEEGLYRCAFEAGEDAVRIRPVRRLVPGEVGRLSLDEKGHRLAVNRAYRPVVVVLDLKDPARPLPPLLHTNVIAPTMSPDGRWVAGGSGHGYGVRVWDARTGDRVTDLVPEERNTRANFGPDGRWLLISTETECGLWEPVTWRPVRQIPREQTGRLEATEAFSPDGKVLAVAATLTTLRLFDTETWRPLARLQGPEADLIDEVGFTPDGTRLLVCGPAGVLRIWDLRRIREQLAGAGLDWEQPAYPPAPPPGDVKPVRVEVDPAWAKAVGFRQEGDAHLQAGRHPEAVAAYSRCLELDPTSAAALYGRARAYESLKRPDKALADLSRAVELQQDFPAPYLELARALRRQVKPEETDGLFDRAESLLRDALAQRRKNDDPESVNTAAVLATLSLTLLDRQKYDAAEPLLRECLTIRRKHLPDNWQTFNASSLLGQETRNLARRYHVPVMPFAFLIEQGVIRARGPVRSRQHVDFLLADAAREPTATITKPRSRIEEFVPRPDDIFIVTYPRSGTTWMQMILYQLTTAGHVDFPHITKVSPWFERSLKDGTAYDALPSPRVFKSHLSYGKVPKGPCKYLYVARDGKDVAVSYYHFCTTHMGFKGTFDEFFDHFLKGEVGYGSWFRHVRGWWEHRDDANVLFLHYEDLVADLPGCLRKISAFSGLSIAPERWPGILERCTFAFMKQHESQFDPLTAMLYEQGFQPNRHLRQGQAGAWSDRLSCRQVRRFHKAFTKRLSAAGIDFAAAPSSGGPRPCCALTGTLASSATTGQGDGPSR